MTSTQIIIILAIGAAVLIAVAVAILLLRRETPRERERKRRLAVYASGRLADGNITEANDGAIHYTYSVGGVEYTTAQDIADLRAWFQVPPERIIGCAVTVKYIMQNPANSIVVCEKWSGLHSIVD